MDINQDKIADKIQKLLALANSPNEHEAKLATERANDVAMDGYEEGKKLQIKRGLESKASDNILTLEYKKQ